MNNSKKKLSVQLRGGFSDRNDIHPLNTTIQYESLDLRSRVEIENTVNSLYYAIFSNDDYFSERRRFWNRILADVYSQPIDNTPGRGISETAMFSIINDTIISDDYSDVLTLIEYLAQYFQHLCKQKYMKIDVYKTFNQSFEKEFIGYRFVGEIISRITSEIEISEIEEASKIKENKVDDHLNKALKLLSSRDNPDYENSIKESISSVEAMCNSITGRKSTLGEALKCLKQDSYIHPSLEAAFEKLYGYTCDASGIRHSGQLNGQKATFEEAKFMLVACSGFVNYLAALYSKNTSM